MTADPQVFNNRFRHATEIRLLTPLDIPDGKSGMWFQKVTLDPEVGPEIAALLVDPTPFAYKLLRRNPFDLRLKARVVRTTSGPIACLLWWFPPIAASKPFALYEHTLNPVHKGTTEILRTLASQTHLHVLLIGPGGQLLDVYELESGFGFGELAARASVACRTYGKIDFDAARLEYEATHTVDELFATGGDEAEDEDNEQDDTAVEETFLVSSDAQPMIDGASYLAARLLTHPDATRSDRRALAKAAFALSRLPRSTPGVCVDFGFNFNLANSGTRYWSVHIDETEVQWSSGGSISGPYGSDSFTSCQYSLLRGAEDEPIGSVQLWLDYYRYLRRAVSLRAEDSSEDNFWKTYERARPWRTATEGDDDER